MTYAACYAHAYRVRSCPSCSAIAHSSYLSMVQRARASLPTPSEQRELERVAERFAGPEGTVRAMGYAVRGEVGE